MYYKKELAHNEIYFIPCEVDGTQSKSENNKCWRGCEKIGTLTHDCWECKVVQLLWETVGLFLKVFNMD